MATGKHAILRITGPDITQDHIEVDEKGLSMGRLESNDLPLLSGKVSRQHARFDLTAQGLTITDLGSSNGTVVNSQRIPANQAVLLKIGDAVQIGPYVFYLKQIAEGKKPASKKRRTSGSRKKKPPAEEQPPAATADMGFPPAPPPPPPPPTLGEEDGFPTHLFGIPADSSSYLQHLPALFGDDQFLGRYLLIMEALHAPLEWIVDNFDCYLDAKLTSSEWLQWFGGWADILVPSEIPIEQQRKIVEELDVLFMTRGTKIGMTRHLELVFGVKPEITEPDDEPFHFTVTLDLGGNEAREDLARRVIDAQRPAHTYYTLTLK